MQIQRNIDINRLSDFVRERLSCTSLNAISRGRYIIISPFEDSVHRAALVEKAEFAFESNARRVPCVRVDQDEQGRISLNENKYPRSDFANLYEWLENDEDDELI